MSDNVAWVFICLNETVVEDINLETGEKQSCYEYDWNEFHAPADELDLEDIKRNPASYVEYTPVSKATEQEKIEAQVMYTALMTDTLLEE